MHHDIWWGKVETFVGEQFLVVCETNKNVQKVKKRCSRASDIMAVQAILILWLWTRNTKTISISRT